MTAGEFEERLLHCRAGSIRASCKREFPIFANNPGLVFLDSGASAQKPRSVIDRVSDYYRTDYANVHRGVYRLSARSTELFEEAREKMRRLPECRRRARDRLCPRRDRGHQPRRPELGRGLSQSRRRGADQRTRAPFEHRALAIAARSHRHPAGRRADRPDRRAGPGRIRGAAVAPHPARRDDPSRQCDRRFRADRDGDAPGSPARRQGADRRLPGGAAAVGRRAGARLRFLCLFRPQDLRPDRDRRALWPLRAAVGDAAVARGRRDDPQCHLRQERVPGSAASVRGRHAGHLRRDRARRRDRLHRGAGPRQYPRARGGADRLRGRPAVARSPVCGWSRPASGGSAYCLSISKGCTRTTSPRCSISIRWRCVPGIIARSR